jgi:glycogen synthase
MRVFMLGWEFPPHISGGLGTACYGITKAITAQGVDVVFVLPRPLKYLYVDEQIETKTPGVPAPSIARTAPVGAARSTEGSLEFRSADLPHVTFHMVDAMLAPYADARGYAQQFVPRGEVMISGRSAPASPADVPAEAPPQPTTTISTVKRRVMAGGTGHYAGDLMTETHRYANLAISIARKDRFDVVHAHDWMTFPAGMAVAAAQRKPLVVHIHSTEFDRAGDHGNPQIFQLEKEGMQAATRVIAVSELTRQLIIDKYGIHPDKIHVVHNGIEIKRPSPAAMTPPAAPPVPTASPHIRIEEQEKIVLFLGRMTAQKGPEYFVAAARKVLEVHDNVKFIMAGSGDMIYETIEQAAEMGIGHKVFFTGFLQGADVERIFKMADLYVMPSVSEPFGIAPLEAMSHDVPVIISKQSGVAEVLDHVLKVDFWDIEDLANKILAVLRHPPLSATLRHRGSIEISQITWADAARKIREIYAGILAKKHARKHPAHAADHPAVPAAATPVPRPVEPPAPSTRAAPAKIQSVAPASAPPAAPVEKRAIPVKRTPPKDPPRAKKPAPQRKPSGPDSPPAAKAPRHPGAPGSQRDVRPVEKLHVKISAPARPVRPASPKAPSARNAAIRAKKKAASPPPPRVAASQRDAGPAHGSPLRSRKLAKKPPARKTPAPVVAARIPVAKPQKPAPIAAKKNPLKMPAPVRKTLAAKAPPRATKAAKKAASSHPPRVAASQRDAWPAPVAATPAKSAVGKKDKSPAKPKKIAAVRGVKSTPRKKRESTSRAKPPQRVAKRRTTAGKVKPVERVTKESRKTAR